MKDIDIVSMRANNKKIDDKRDYGLPTNIPEVMRIDNLKYGPDPKWNLLDIYLPKKHKNKIPTIINIHGGGWFYGTKETYQFYGLSLAKEGFGVVNFNYRLAPDVKFPEELNDVNLLIHWIAKNGNKYNLDMENVFLIGDSAGAQMVEQYLAVLTNNSYRKLFNYELPSLKIKAAALNCGAYFLLSEDFSKINNITSSIYFTPDIIHNQREKLNVEDFLTPELPPLYIMTGNEDMLHDYSIRLDGYLLAKQIRHELHVYGDNEHPCRHVFHIDQKNTLAKICNQNELDFFKRFLVLS